jgi:hypothetical protein
MRQIADTLRARGKLSREKTTRAIGRVTGEFAGLAGKAPRRETFSSPRPLDVTPARLLRLDGRVYAHRVSLAKKAVAA